jgi:hypothetical protein
MAQDLPSLLRFVVKCKVSSTHAVAVVQQLTQHGGLHEVGVQCVRYPCRCVL